MARQLSLLIHEWAGYYNATRGGSQPADQDRAGVVTGWHHLALAAEIIYAEWTGVNSDFLDERMRTLNIGGHWPVDINANIHKIKLLFSGWTSGVATPIVVSVRKVEKMNTTDKKESHRITIPGYEVE